jgi:hypothetical protein
VNHTATCALRRLSELDPATQFSRPEEESEIDLRIARILASPAPEPMVSRYRVHTMRFRSGVALLAISFVMAAVAVVAWATPAQGMFASHGRTVASLSALHPVSTAVRTDLSESQERPTYLASITS